MRGIGRYWMMTFLFAAAGGAVCGCGPKSESPDWIHGWKLVRTDDVDAELKAPLPGETGAGVTVAFDKTGTERRMLTLQAATGLKPQDVHTVDVRYRLDLVEGPPPRLAVVAFEDDGGAYFSIAPAPLDIGKLAREQVPVDSPRPAAFSQDKDGQCQWPQVNKIWIGLVLDAPARGRLKVLGANLSSQAWRPRRPLPFDAQGASVWQLTQDPAAQATLVALADGPEGRPGMKLDFTIPGHRHMYALAWTDSPPGDLSPYYGLGMKVNVRLPAGDARLLVSLTEAGGAQYYFEPDVPVGDQWVILTIPFANFKPADWAKDDNGRLNLNQITRVTVGVHGTADEAMATGRVMAAGLQYLLETDAGPATPERPPGKRGPTTAPVVVPPTVPPTTAPAMTPPTTQPTTAPATPPPDTQPTTAPAMPPPDTQPSTEPATQPAAGKD